METLATPPDVRARAFLKVEDVAERYGLSKRTIHELTRMGRIPNRVLPWSRRCLFEIDQLEAWQNGAELETVALAGGGRVVRVVP